MKKISTSIVIKASPEKVWAVLMDFERYPTWNPFIKSISGQAVLGKQIVARIEPPKATGMTFKPNVVALVAQKEFAWLGHLFFAGLFDGLHRFELIDNKNGTITFVQSEDFSGILVPLFAKMLDNQTVNGFNLMNEALKERCEK